MPAVIPVRRVKEEEKNKCLDQTFEEAQWWLKRRTDSVNVVTSCSNNQASRKRKGDGDHGSMKGEKNKSIDMGLLSRSGDKL